ncbi:MAG: hypothetical protein KDA95_00570 [Acidimicrobiales bacterium]|nr:hypothetical protein [Acidimicrobiales bacterium]
MTLHRTPSMKQSGGFTISELVLVLAILAGLAAIVVWSLSGMDKQQATRDCRSELRVIKIAVEQYKAEQGSYPVDDAAMAQADVLALSETPNWKVVTEDQSVGPKFLPEGGRCA